MSKCRVPVNLNDEVYDYYKNRSIATGIPMSSLMFLALEQQMQTNILVNKMNEKKSGTETDKS